MRRKGTSLVALVALLASGFTFLEAPAPASAAIVTSNLVLNLDASNTSSMAATGVTGWNSVSPASSAATSTFFGNAARVSDVTGASMSMDGAGDAAVFPAGTARTAGAMTIETWVKPGNLRAGWNILASRWFPTTARAGSAVDQDWHFALYGSTASNIKLQLNTGAGLVTGNTVFPATSANKWYHLAVTIDAANTVTMWVNGVADGSSANFPHTDNGTAQLHVGDVGADTTLLGNMSRFRLYNTALTSAQLAQNFLTDSVNYGYAPANTVAPTVTGTAKVGTALSATDGTWGVGDAAGTTTAYKWQTSTDGSTGWTDIAGATNASYTPVANDALNFLRVNVTKTNSAGSATASSEATVKVQTQNGISMVSSGKLTGLTATVPNDATIYNVTLSTSNLSATMTLGTTTGLTVVPGYASTASYMASAITSAAPIITFRGAGTAINTALANVSYTSDTKQVDLIKLYYATAGATDTDTKNYIPIYDNNQLTFHYYTYKNHAAAKNRSDMDASLVGLTTTDNVQAPGPWYLVTPRYQIEWTRTSAIIGSNTNVWMGATSANGSTDWYWPANTDGYPSATKFAANGVGSSNIFNGTSTALPYCANEPNGGSTGNRSGFFYICGGNLGWDDTPVTSTTANFVMETYGTAPFNTGVAGSLAMTNSIVATSFDAPTGVTATATGAGSIFVSWTAPAANTTINPLNSHKVEYSTSAAFTTFSTAIVSGASYSSTVISGLSANTLYYFRVFAYGAKGGQPYGVTSAAVSTTTLSTATTITVVSTGGGVSGTDYTISKGTIFPKSGTSANVNASDIQTSLGSITTLLAADNVVISAPITWSSGSYLQLGNGSSSSVTINKTITSSGSFSQLIIPPTTYTLDVKNGASIQFTSALSQYLTIGGTSYTLLKTEAQIAALAATTGNYALAKPLTFASAYTASPINVALFAGTIDGLGNTVNGMTLNSSTVGSVGFVRSIAPGAVIRNLGLTNVAITISSYTGGMELGALVGQSTGGTLDQVWTTGSIKTSAGASVGSLLVGGIVSYASTGTTTITKSWSSVSIDTSTATYAYLGQGGIIGADIYSYGQVNTGSGGNVTLSQVYSIGNQKWTTTSQTWHGVGGIMGLHFSTATTSFTDVFAWSSLSHEVDANNYNYGGILGVSQTGTGGVASTFTNNYTTFGTCVDSGSNTVAKACTVNVVPGNSVSAMTGSNWTTNATYGTYLTNVAPPVKPLFVQVVAPADNSYTGITNRVLDSNGTVQTLSSLNLSTSGTPVYSILANAAKATYPSVTYTSGLSFGGTAAGAYSVNSWATGTSVTISRVPQTFTWNPTTSISFGSGTFTPSAAPVSSAGSTISYAVSSAGTTGCTVNPSTGAVTYTAAGSCSVTATAAQTTDYTGATATVTFSIAEAAAAPTVTTASTTTTSLLLSWTTPTVNSSVGLTGYQILYSTSADMSGATTVNTGNTNTTRLFTGLASGTTYYFQVRAVGGSTWLGTVNASAVTGTPKVSNTTITVVASGGGVLGTDFKLSNGVLYTTNASASVNVADIQNELLTKNVVIAAENVVVNKGITWATSQNLTLGTSSSGSLAINDSIIASGATAGLVITPSTYTLNVRSGAEIILSGSSSTLSIGGTNYTLIRSIADLSTVTATGNYALSQPLAFSSTALTAAPITSGFTGTFDGLGNTLDGMIMTVPSTGMGGLFGSLTNGAAVRNLGVTNVKMTMANSASSYVAAGVITANVPSSTTGTVTLNRVWSSGFITGASGTIQHLAAGGLVAWAQAGTVNISQSWSSVNIDVSAVSATNLAVGGLLGTDVSAMGQGWGSGGANFSITESYSTGNIKVGTFGWVGIGGLVGLHWSSSTTSISDSFHWGLLPTGTGNTGGILGASGSVATPLARTYTTSTCVNGAASIGCTSGQTIGATVSGMNTAAWTSTGASALVNVATPTRPLYVQVLTNTNGTYDTVSYQIVDGSGADQNAAALTALGLSVSGTAAYTPSLANAPISASPYSFNYSSGLTLGGSNASLYSLLPWRDATSVTISKLNQTISYTSTIPATPKVAGTYTPAATSTSALTVAFTVDATSSAVCSIAAGVVTFNSVGTCLVNANQAGNTNYAAAAQVQQTITVAKGDQTVSITSTAPTTTAKVGSTYALIGSATSGLTPIYSADASSAGICTVSGSTVSLVGIGACKILINQAGNTNWNAATQNSQSFSVGKGNQTISFTSTVPSSAVVGGSAYTIAGTVTGGGTVTYSIDTGSTAVCSVTGSSVSFQSVGTCKVLADSAATTNWSAATQNFQSFLVGKGTPTLAFTSSATSPKVNSTYTPVASSASTGAITYSIDASTSSVCSISSGIVSFLTVGICKVNANQVTDTNYLAATQVQQSITVAKGDQTITFSSTAATPKVNTTYTPLATSTSGGTVVFTIDATSSAVCSISLGIVIFSAVGNCKVNANQVGDANWNTATQVQQIIPVTKGDQTISITSATPAAKVAGATYTPTATSTSGVTPVFTVDSSSSSICSIAAGVVSFLAVGTCKVNANEAGGTNWNAATQVQQSITVAKGISTIVITSTAPTTAVVGGATYTLTSTKTAANTNSVVYSVDSTTSTICSVSGAVVSFLLVGTCKVNANLDTNTQYEAATQQQQVITVNQGSQTVAFTSSAPNAAKVGAPNYTVTATGGPSTSAIMLSVDSSATSKCSVSGMVVTYLAVGDCVLNLNQAGDANYNAAAQVQQTVTITTDGRCPNGVVSGNYCLVKFNANGSWKVPTGVTRIDVVAVGAGGAGGGGAGTNSAPGGGGGGEVLETLGISVTAGTVISASVGTGGIGGGAASDASASTNGGSTTVTGTNSFASITARGGGAGATWRYVAPSPGYAQPAGTGNSVAGGGGGHAQIATRVAAPGAGGVSTGGTASSGSTGDTQVGGGGGGAGGNGVNASGSAAGNGGPGKNSVILGTLLGGGGGGAKRTGTGAIGVGFNGGGAGGVGAAGIPGTANTGGGGGGSGGALDGANGGSGVVAIRFAMTDQTVAFTSTAPTGLIYGTSTTYNPTISATASEASGTITVDSSSSAVCSISAGVVSIIGAGTCTLNANQAGNGFYAPATQVQQTFSVAKQDQTLSFTSTAPTNAVVDGNTYTVAGTSTSGGSVAFSIAPGSSNVCTITAEVVTFRGAGTCTVLANQAGNANWNGATQISQTINVGKGAQTINFTSTIPTNAVVGWSTYTVTATGGASDNARVFASTTTAVCTIAGNVVTFLASGACEITANQAGNDDYLAAPEVTQTIAVGAGTQAINFTSTIPTNAVVGGPTYSVSASGGASGKPVTFSVTSTTICSISAGVVTFLAAGDCVVEANQAGTANWNPATAATQTITVGKGTQVILFTSTAPTNAVVDGSTYTVTAAGGQSGKSVVISVSSPSVCSINNGVVSFLTAGDCVVAANQDGNDDWNASNENTQTISVGKGAQVVAFTSAAPTGVRVDDSAYTPTATGGASGNAVTLSIAPSSSVICEINNGEVSFHAVGSCVLELNQAGDPNYVAASQVTQTITVAKGLQTITKTSTDPIDAVVAGATYTPTFNGGASGSAVVVTISSATAARCEILNGTISFISAGDCDVVVNQPGNANYEAAPELTFTISVGKGSQVISWTSSAPNNAVVGGTTYTPAATGGATGNNVSFRVDSNTASVCAMSLGVVRFVGIGTCTVLANQIGNANYLGAPQESQTFTVGRGIQSINFTSAIPTAVVDGASYTPVATGGATGNTVTFSIASGSSSVCTLAFGRVTFQNVGTCDVEANQLGNTNYNAAAQVVQSITVGKGAQVVAFTSAAPSAKVGGTTYEPVVSGGASGNSVTLSIAPASSSICSVNNGAVSFQAVGSCVVEANQATSANYEAAAQVTQTITVAKGVQVLNFTSTPPSLRPVQGTTYIPAVTSGNSGEPVVFTIGAEAASICTIANGTISFLAVGDCVLYADQAGNANYTAATRITQVFDITKGEQIVNINSTAPTTAVVDGATYTPTGTGGAGTKPTVFTATAESAGICSVLEGIVYFDGAGDCVIALNQAGDTNYNAATQKLQNISVGKGTQTITFSSTNTTATVDGATYTPTYTDGEGINPVRISVLGSSSLICEVNAGVVSFHAVGDCVIEATQAGDNNYEAAQQVSQTITVAKGNQATLVGHSSLSSLTLGNSTPTAVLSTTGGSGIGSVSWTVTPETAAYCSVTGDVVSGLASGYCDLVATKLGDGNYLDATATLSVVVSTGGQTPVRTSINETSPTFSEGKTLTLALAGGDGDGAVWYESLTTHVCNTNGGTALNVYHAGTCTVIGHKDGDDNYEAVANTLSFEIAKATQVGVTIHIAQALTYSPDGAVSAALSLEDVLASGTQSFSVTSGSCSIVGGSLSATEAGDCEVTASILGDDKYLDGTFTHTFTIAKAAQAAVTATLATNAPPAIAWNGTKVTTFNIAGGSGPVSLTTSTTTPTICSVAIEGSVVSVTGIAQGTCDVSVSNAASANYLAASKLFSVDVLDLASAPTSVAATTPARNNGAITSTISWVAPTAADTRATVTGYKVQSRIGTADWTDVANGTVASSSTSLAVTLEPWSKYNFRVAATTDLDGETLNWAYFDLAGDNVPDLLPVGGGLVTLSTTKAATTSGETVYVTGVGFQDAGITSVEISTPTAVFTASIRAAALITTKTVPATVISDTKLSFVLPKITLPKGVTTLQATIKVVNDEQLRSDPIPLDYIPKKLAQTLTATLPPVTNIIAVGTPLISTATVISSNLTNPPVVNATPSSVCTATINVLNKLVITPVSPGKCSISVVVPGTPAYTATAAKTAVYSVKAYRTAGLTATADNVTQAGVRTPTTFDITSGISNASINVVIGENAVEVPVALSKREGTVLFTVDAASESASRCTADSGDVSALIGSITMNDIGTCKVTITLPVDDKYFVGTEIIVLTVNGVAYVRDPAVPTPQDNGDAALVPANELADIIDPKDPDDPMTPPVMIDLDPDRAADYNFGTEDGLAFDPATKKLNVRSRTALVGTWTVTLSSPNVNKKWFKIPGKIVKKVQTYTYSNICKLTLTVKKDPKLKKKVTRIVGAGCILSSATDPGFKAGTESGWTALTSVGIQKIKVKYKRTRQYAKTGLNYVKVKGNRVLKNINRTWVVKIGRRS